METNMNDVMNELIKQMQNEKAFDKAMQYGYVMPEKNGYLRWTLGSQTLLSYFLGKIFCGDKCLYSTRKHTKIWTKGKGRFPAKNLGAIFRVKSIKRLRLKHLDRTMPKSSDMIDELFD